MGSSSETLGELAGMPALIRLAQQLCQTLGELTSCFISVDRLSHRAFPLAIKADVVQGRKTWSGWGCGVLFAGCGCL